MSVTVRQRWSFIRHTGGHGAVNKEGREKKRKRNRSHFISAGTWQRNKSNTKVQWALQISFHMQFVTSSKVHPPEGAGPGAVLHTAAAVFVTMLYCWRKHSDPWVCVLCHIWGPDSCFIEQLHSRCYYGVKRNSPLRVKRCIVLVTTPSCGVVMIPAALNRKQHLPDGGKVFSRTLIWLTRSISLSRSSVVKKHRCSRDISRSVIRVNSCSGGWMGCCLTVQQRDGQHNQFFIEILGSFRRWSYWIFSGKKAT